MVQPKTIRPLVFGVLVLAMVLPIVVLMGADASRMRMGRVEMVWGRRGSDPGFFQKPRAMAIDAQDRLFVVDKAARIQVFDRNGNFSHGWTTPAWKYGKPTGLSFDNDGNLMVADTHYYRVLFYTPEGEWLEEKTIGGEEGTEPGKFAWVTDAVQDSKGNYYVSQYGELDRVQKFSADGEYIWGWGSHGDGPLELKRPQNLAIDQEDNLWIVDACNHRILVFDVSGDTPPEKPLKCWGEMGSEPGQMRYPYDLVLDGPFVYVCEFGNHRVQKFTKDGELIGTWGKPGRAQGELANPWAIVKDSSNRLHVLDTNNQRVQRIRL